MANSDSSLIDNLIQEIQNTFDKIKSGKTSKFQAELLTLNQETNNLKNKIYTKLDELAQVVIFAISLLIQSGLYRLISLLLQDYQAVNEEVAAFKKEFDDSIAKITNTLSDLAAGNKPVVTVEIDTLKQETDALVTKINNKLDEIAAEQDLSALKQEVTDWQEKINKKLEELVSTSEANQKIDSLILDFKSSLVQRTSAPELQEKIEVLIQELKAQMAEALPEVEVTKLLQTIAFLMIKDEVSNLNQRINNLIEKTKNKVAEFPPELDREVQGELGKLIKILGIAQIELRKDSNSNRIAQVKSLIDYVEIAIDSLTGKPNLVLAQKLRYASKTRLRKIQGGWMRIVADWRDDIFHAVKTPTKVLLGVVLAVPLTWCIVKVDWFIFPPVQKLLLSLPALETTLTPTQKATPFPSPTQKATPSPSPTQKATPSPSPTQKATPSSSPANELKTIDETTLNFVILLLMTGTLGGVVSILTRIQEFDNPKTQKYEDDFLPVLIGLIKPALGGSFAFFIFLLLNSGVSPIEIKGKGDNDNTYLYGFLALAFIAGFSERFVPDLISQVEKTYAPLKTPEQGQGLPRANLSIQPSTVPLKYGDTKKFNLNPSLPSSDYEIGLTSDKDGEKGTTVIKTSSEFEYTAPTQAGAADITTVTITVTSNIDPQQKATATVKLIV